MNPTSREDRAGMLALAAEPDLVGVADGCLRDGTRPRLVLGPQVGTVLAQVRDPVAAQRFHLGDVLACRCEVVHRGARGWAMRLGEDRAATLAAAICDAEAEAGGPGTAEVDALCRRTALRLAGAEAEEWAALAPTVVQFEELT